MQFYLTETQYFSIARNHHLMLSLKQYADTQIKLKPVGTYTSHIKLSEHTLHTQSCQTYTSFTKLLEHTLHKQSCRNMHYIHKAVGTYILSTKLSEHILISKHTDSSAYI